jgi:hypothetical protein
MNRADVRWLCNDSISCTSGSLGQSTTPFTADQANGATTRSSLHRSDRGANRVDDADELVAHPIPRVTRRHRVIGPEIADADAGPGHPNQGIGRLDEPGVANGLERTSCAPYITVACIWAPSFLADATVSAVLFVITLSIQHAAPIRPSTELTLDS